MKKGEIEPPKKIRLTVEQYHLLEMLAEQAGTSPLEFVRTKMSEQIEEVIVSDEPGNTTQVVASRQQFAPTDTRRQCSSCHQAVFLHDEPPSGIPVVCVKCAGLNE